MTEALRVLAVTNMYPNAEDPVYGIFVARQMAAIQKLGLGVEIEFIDGRDDTWAYGRGIRRLQALTRGGAFDIVHAHYGLSGFVATFQPTPFVVSFCGDDLLGTPDGRGGKTLKSRIGIHLSRIAARRADGIICKSEGLRAALPRRRDRERARVIGNGIDTDTFSPGDRSGARARLGKNPEETLILFPHDPEQREVKRFDLAEAALAHLPANHSGARLWMVSGVHPDAMPDYYRAADCMLLTSDHEGSPNVVKEALCCDIPVVAVDAGDAHQWMSMAPGCAFVERTPSAIAEGISKVLAGPRRVDGGRIRDALAGQVVARQVISLYEEIVHRGPIPR